MNIIVCGTTFGQFYCEAIYKDKENFNFKGIVGKGSIRSIKCAQKYNTKLIKNIDDIGNDIDIACVALRSSIMGGKGTDVVIKLLEKGVNVIQEQPVHYKDVERCIKVAKKNNVMYCVGNLYKHLPAVKKYISLSKKIFKEIEPMYIEAGGAAQVSYALLDIITDCLPRYRPFLIKNVDRNSGPFNLLTADIGKVPVIFQIHNEVNPKDPDNHMHYLQRITIGNNCGRLCLEDTQGPICWHNKMHFPKDIFNNDGFDGDIPKELLRSCSIDIGEIRGRSFLEVFRDEWVNAVQKDIYEMIRYVNKIDNINQYYSKLIFVSRLWHNFTKKLGYANTIDMSIELDTNIEELLKDIN